MHSKPCIFISGAAQGIGRATALRFARQGWFVGLADVDIVGAQALAGEIGPDARAYRLDVTQMDEWRHVLRDFHALTGRLDLLLNNAGVVVSGPFEASALERHHALVDVNVKGLMSGCWCAHPYLKTTPGARLINLSSASAVYGQPFLASYSASKFAVRGLTEALDLEWRKDGIRVMDVMPLFVRTQMTVGMNARSIERLGIHLTPEDVAEVIWKAATARHHRLHWQVGWMGALLYRLTALTPDAINRFVMARIGT